MLLQCWLLMLKCEIMRSVHAPVISVSQKLRLQSDLNTLFHTVFLILNLDDVKESRCANTVIPGIQLKQLVSDSGCTDKLQQGTV